MLHNFKEQCIQITIKGKVADSQSTNLYVVHLCLWNTHLMQTQEFIVSPIKVLDLIKILLLI